MQYSLYELWFLKGKYRQKSSQNKTNISKQSDNHNTPQYCNCSWDHFCYSRGKIPKPTALLFKYKNHGGPKKCQNFDGKL